MLEELDPDDAYLLTLASTKEVSDERRTPPANVVTMDKVKQPHPNRRMRKAVYCTCWDGDIVIEAGANTGALRVVQPQETN
ncbi:MAG TPA: hypothetical protein VK363_03250 [Pyrinomonadaceae bacterium]|nr:hypothetical protein [Pyrinomonadaceae bacterium]